MERLLTTEQAAREFRVSPSTIKRFCDQNVSIVRRTPGGHRRIDYQLLADAIHSQSNFGARKLNRVLEFEETLSRLIEGDAVGLLQLILEASRSPEDWLAVLEQSLVPALWRIGEMWGKNVLTVSGEKIATDCASVVLDALIARVEVAKFRRTIVGGALAGCWHTIASKLIVLGAKTVGVRAIDLGCNCSPEHLEEARGRMEASAIWVSHTHIVDVDDVVAQHAKLRRLVPYGTEIYVGGGSLTPSFRVRLQDVLYCETIQQMLDRLVVL